MKHGKDTYRAGNPIKRQVTNWAKQPSVRNLLFKERELIEAACYAVLILGGLMLLRPHLLGQHQQWVDTVFSLSAIGLIVLYVLGAIKPVMLSRFYPILLRTGDAILYQADTTSTQGQLRQLTPTKGRRLGVKTYAVEVQTDQGRIAVDSEQVLAIVILATTVQQAID